MSIDSRISQVLVYPTLFVLLAGFTSVSAQSTYNEAVVGYAYVTATGNTPTTWAYNRAGSTIQVSHPETGYYVVAFEDAGDYLEGGGHVQVSAFGSQSTVELCHTSGWSGPNEQDLTVHVRCYHTDNGEPFNSAFTVLVLDEGNATADNNNLAFAWSLFDEPPDGEFDIGFLNTTHNPSGGETTLFHDGAGEYRVVFRDIAPEISTSGNVQVTPHGLTDGDADGRICRTTDWYGFGSDFVVEVECQDNNGWKVNNKFNVLLTSVEDAAPGFAYALVLGEDLSSDWTEESGLGDNNPFGLIEARRLSEGVYQVRFHGLSDEAGGTFVVTPREGTLSTCKVGIFGTSSSEGYQQVLVKCYDTGGNPIDAGFTVLSTFVNAMPVADEVDPEEVDEGLSVPAPNPTRRTATVTLSVRRGQSVSVNVLDALGRHVRTLFDGALAGGVPEPLTLDATALPAGVYVVRAIGDDFAISRHLTVVK